MMKIKILKNHQELGVVAAKYSADILNQCINERGSARLVLSTGASQFETINNLIKADVDWSKVEMFHLDEYIDLPETHPASFRKYLKERFIRHLQLKNYYLVDGEGDIQGKMYELTKELRKAPIDLGIIGIGENAHIAFNDPPADFNTKEAYIIVNLDENCKSQQVGEGWFSSLAEVPKQAISMSVYQILQCNRIVSCVPHKVKANALKHTFESDITNKYPATILQSHPQAVVFADMDSASLIDKQIILKYQL